nr:G protein-coupled receptor [Proales similis]
MSSLGTNMNRSDGLFSSQDSSVDLNKSALEMSDDLLQHQIYSEFRRSPVETFRHILAVLGSLICLIGVAGNAICLFIMLRGSKRRNKKGHLIYRPTGANISTFFTYLSALSLCDLLSCALAIVNMIQFLPPPYLDWYPSWYHQTSQLISFYTHPIVVSLQALSVWIICAFSIHRCRTVLSSGLKSSSSSPQVNAPGQQRRYFFGVKLVNNFTSKVYNLKFYSWSLFELPLLRCCFCELSKESKPETDRKDYGTLAGSLVSERRVSQSSIFERLTSLSKSGARLVVFFLFFTSLVYMIPQYFEKRLITVHVHNRSYIFATLTETGRSEWYRQLFHLWFYLIAVYSLPLLFTLIFNGILLKAFVRSRQRCEKYKLCANPVILMNEPNSVGSQETRRSELGSKVLSERSFSPTQASDSRRSSKRSFGSFVRAKETNLSQKRKSLTLLLFGVVAVFSVCHLPGIVSKLLFVLKPRLEMEHNHPALSILLDVSNFLIMLNSSINFILYIVLGPGKFREEFQLIFSRWKQCCYPNSGGANLAESGTRDSKRLSTSSFQCQGLALISSNRFPRNSLLDTDRSIVESYEENQF